MSPPPVAAPSGPDRPVATGLAGRVESWWYDGLDASAGHDARALDRLWLDARYGLRPAWWAGIAAALSLTTLGLRANGVPLRWALLIGAFFVGFSLLAMRAAWLEPQKFGRSRMLWLAGMMVLGTYAGALSGAFAGLWDAGAAALPERLLRALWRATPAQLLAGLVLLLVLWAVATGRRAQIQRALDQSRLEAERDAAARLAAEARLQLLQAQIQPHFLFNTLAALQHWVDTGDARAAPLLRVLTSFLRGSTALMTREQVTLADELPLARDYLAIMQARLGERLQAEFSIDAASQRQPLPPALLLTLLENAVEHGIAPALGPGQVRVVASQQGGEFVLTVHDSGAGPAAGWTEGVGLANCRERLVHRFGATGARLSLQHDAAGTRAEVRIATALQGPA